MPARPPIAAYVLAGPPGLLLGCGLAFSVAGVCGFHDPMFDTGWRRYDDAAHAWVAGSPDESWVEPSSGGTVADGRSLGLGDDGAYYLESADGVRTPLSFSGERPAYPVTGASLAPDGTLGATTCDAVQLECRVLLLAPGTTSLVQAPDLPASADDLGVITPLASRGWMIEAAGEDDAYWLVDGAWREVPTMDLVEERHVASDGTLWCLASVERVGWELYVFLVVLGLPVAVGVIWLLTRGERPWRDVAIGWAVSLVLLLIGWLFFVLMNALHVGGP